MTRTFNDARVWMVDGTKLLLEAVAGLDEDDLDAATLLPDWTRKHLVAHVAANAEAIANLVQWAATGVKTPMYASPEERAAGIARGPSMSADELVAWLSTSARLLDEGMDRLTDEQWRRPVVTAQGRTVPASEAPWMRAREVCVHAIDLGTGLTFADLPGGFSEALREDICAKRGLRALPPEVTGAPLPEVTAWLAGRPHSLTAAPELGPWL